MVNDPNEGIELFGEMCYPIELVAERLKCHKETILRYIRRGKLRAQKIGRRYFVSEDNIRDL